MNQGIQLRLAPDRSICAADILPLDVGVDWCDFSAVMEDQDNETLTPEQSREKHQ
jgi:hypothetical protein